MQQPSIRTQRVLTAVVLTLSACFVHLRELLGERLYWRDTHIMYVPMKHFLAETIRGGELPQWWPYDGGGTPFLALPMMSTFHPTTLAYLVLPFWSAFAFQNLAGSLIGVFGTYFAARALRMPRMAAVIAGAVFIANGYCVSLTEHTFMKLSVATIPWYIWALLAAARRGGGWWIAPSVAMGLLLLGGDPQAAILATIAGAVLLFAMEGLSRTTIAAAVLAPAAGATLAAVQLLPSLGIASETERAGDVANANQWALDSQDLLGLLTPIDLGGYRFSRSMVLGVVVVALLFASLSRIRRRGTLALWALLVVGLWLSAGDAFGLNVVAKAVVPLWSKFRYPIKASALTMTAAALLAAEGFVALASARSRGRAWRLAGASASAAVIAAFAGGVANVSLIWWLGTATTCAALIALTRKSGALRAFAAGMVVVSVLATGQQQLRTVDASFYDPSPLVSALQKAGVALEGPAFDRVDGRPFPPDVQPFVNEAGVGGQSVAAGARFHLPVLSFYAPGVSKRVLSFFTREPMHVELGAKVKGIFGVGYLVAPYETVSKSDLTILGREPSFNYVVVKLRRSLPRAYAVHRALSLPDLDAAYARLKEGAFKPGREVFIEGEVPAENASRLDQFAVPMDVTHRTNTTVTLSGDLPWSGWVVLNEAAYKGWSVVVDGRASTTRIANGLVRAVEVSAGPHRVEWKYETPGLNAGIAVSLVSALLLLVAAILLHQHRVRGPTALQTPAPR